jgi:hypothetical protein
MKSKHDIYIWKIDVETFINVFVSMKVQSFDMNEFTKWRRRYCPFYEHAVKIGSSID